MDKHLSKAIKQAQRNGWELTRCKDNGHWKLFKRGEGLVYIASSASDHRTVKNTLADMRRQGAL